MLIYLINFCAGCAIYSTPTEYRGRYLYSAFLPKDVPYNDGSTLQPTVNQPSAFRNVWRKFTAKKP